MPEFVYVALNKMGRKVQGTVHAATEAAARADVKARRYELHSLREHASWVRRLDRWVAGIRPLSATEVAVSARQLAVMSAAGIPLGDTLNMLANLPLSSALHRAWEQVHTDVNGGSSLSSALRKHPAAFGTLFVGLVRSGETTGNLSENLARVADYLERQVALQQKVKAALTYPIFVFVVCLALATLIVQHVLPEFLNGLFKNSGVELPLITRVLVWVTSGLNDPRTVAVGMLLLVTGGVLVYKHLKTPEGRLQFQQLCLRSPVLQNVLKKLLTVRFCRTMAAVLRGGLSASLALKLTADCVDSMVLSDYLKTAEQDLQDGNPLARCIRAIPLFPTMLNGFMELGEETGKIPELLDRLAESFEQDLDLALVAFTQLIEPVMVSVMGGFVGFVLIAIFIPLYKILGNF